MAKRCKNEAWEDLDLTRDEVDRIGAALKKEEFRKLLQDYAEEINDPENKKQYEKEITELEKERGVAVTFVNPEPCYVIKSSVDGSKKAFINVCKNEKVGKPTSEPVIKPGTRGLNWSLPYTQAPPRDDIDKNGNRCVVFDVVFHPDTHHLATNNVQFRKMLDNTAMDAVEDNFNVHLDRKNVKFPKMKYKGVPRPTVIRKKVENVQIPKDEFSVPESVYPYRPPMEEAEIQARNDEANKRREERERANLNKLQSVYTTPKYVMKQRQCVDIQDFSNDRNSKMNAVIPKELVLVVELPLLNNSSDMTLDVTEKSITLVSEKPSKYKLELSLPYSIDEEGGSAKFDKSTRKLTITLPVRKHKTVQLIDIGKEDSGVESDVGHRTPESSSDEEMSLQNSVIEINKNEALDINRNEEPTLQNNRTEDATPEFDRSGDTIPQIAGNEAYRTISVAESKKFLNPDVHYLFPAFTCNVVDNIVAFTLHVKNVEPESIEHKFLGEDASGFHIKFNSIGSGFFPIHYAFCLKFPLPATICEDLFGAEAWDNNVIVQIQLNPCDPCVVEYNAGLDENSVTKYSMPEPAAISTKLEQLEIDALESSTKTDVTVEVIKYTENELTVQVSPEKTETVLNEDDDEDVSNSNTQTDNQKASEKCRTMSESSGDELSLSPTKKGILKNNGRVCRSLSESSMDDYAWSSSLDMVTQSGSESCIPEEALEEERETKKTVRFNEVVSQKTYRTNSSILGQRKKNQRKTRNKRRCQERRASESENSEGEVEKERERKTEEEEEEKQQNEVQDDIIPAVQETEEPTPPESQVNCRDHQPATKPSPKGKRRNRKGANASHSSISGATQVEFGNDLIFDLDM